MRRISIFMVLVGALAFCGTLAQAACDGGSRLVPTWPTLPSGMYFGLKEAPPPPAEREAEAAARRARGGAPAGGGGAQAPQPGISGIAIDAQDHIYVFNRGP